MIKGILRFYITTSHKDYKTAKYQSNEARKLHNTLNKLKEEKSNLRKDKNYQTPVANSLKIDLSKTYSESWRKQVEQAQNVVLPQKVAQHVGKQCDEAWSSVIAKRSQGKPARNPKYKNNYCELRFTKQAFSHSRKAVESRLIIPTGWKFGIKLPKHVNLVQIESLLLIPCPDGFELRALYIKDATAIPPVSKPKVFAGGDLGLNKLITIVSTDGSRPKTIDGRGLKSINRYFNKKVAVLASKRSKSKDFGRGGERERLSKAIDRLWAKRDRQINHFLNVASNEIVGYLGRIGVQCFVVGWSVGFKDSVCLGSRNNQNFVSVPHGRFRDLLVRKCGEAGISVVLQEESYTSKASFVDGDFIPVFVEGASVKHGFSGRRVYRGEYKSGTGMKLHADVNGAWNILRKSKPSIGWCSGVVAYPENLKVKL